MSADVRVGQAIQPDQFGMPQYTVKPRRRRRWWLITLTIIIAFVCLWWFWPRNDRILDLAAELDQRDPGWRWDDLRASQPKLPDGENSFPLLTRIGNAIPAISLEYRTSTFAKPRTGPGSNMNRIGDDLVLTKPTEPLDEKLAKELITELQATEPARKLLSELLRFQSARTELPPFLQLLNQGATPSLKAIYKIRQLLDIALEDALENKDSQAAQMRARCLIHGLRLIGNVSDFDLRDYLRNITKVTGRIERMLAHFEGEEASLKQLQDELQQWDVDQPFRFWMRWRRAFDFALYDVLANHLDEINETRKMSAWDRIRLGFSKNNLIEGQTLTVEFYTYRLDQLVGEPRANARMHDLIQRVETIRPKNGAGIQALWNELTQESVRQACNTIDSFYPNIELAMRQAQAAQQVMVAAIAAERFRLKNGRWPNDLHELVPAYLTEVPKDPCSSGDELHWKVTPTGRVVYSVGLDGIDDGGKCEWTDFLRMGPEADRMVDIGFRLFDQRVQPKAKSSAH